MKQLDKLNEAARMILHVTQDINEEIARAINVQAPHVVYQRFCHELAELVRDKGGVIPKDDPQMRRVLDAISYLEEVYPEIKDK